MSLVKDHVARQLLWHGYIHHRRSICITKARNVGERNTCIVYKQPRQLNMMVKNFVQMAGFGPVERLGLNVFELITCEP